MKPNPRIAIIGLKGLPAFGGAAAVGESIIEQLKDNYDFTVYSTSSHTNEKTGKYKGFRQIVFNRTKNKKLNTLIYYIFSALHILFKSNYDLVHLHHRDASFIIPFLRLRNKVVLTTHGMELTDKWKSLKWLFNIQDRFFLGLASRITTVSMKDNRIVKEILKNRKEPVYIPNGVNLISNQSLSETMNNENLVFAAGRIIPNKGCHVFLKALKEINYSGPVKIIGDLDQMPTYKKSLLELARDIKNIEFLGLIRNRQTLNKYLETAKVFIYPSEIESMSMMMLEVASFKTPLICCEIPENLDVFNREQLLYFKTGDSKDLAEKINWALNNYPLMKEKANKAYQKLESDYQWYSIAVQYVEVYESLLGNNS